MHNVAGDGSSPRRRGTRTGSLSNATSLRFIPAQAGNTRSSICATMSIAVHPRAGGEHGASDQPQNPCNGSSPRRRGTPIARPRAVRSQRFIPAQAGNTAAMALERVVPAVHPRAGGEHDMERSRMLAGDGSSPRRRGTLPPGRSCRRSRRFIPAQAGNTGGSLGFGGE